MCRASHSGHSDPVYAAVKNLRRKLGDDADNLTHIAYQPWIGYRMDWNETQ